MNKTTQPPKGWSSFEEWMAQVPESMRNDPLWGFQVYPKALFLSDLVWEDTTNTARDPRGSSIARQLVRSAGSICANIEEGHGRGFGRDNAYFQRVALGSARETRGWYYRGRRFLPPRHLSRAHPPSQRHHRRPCPFLQPATPLQTLTLHPASCILHPSRR